MRNKLVFLGFGLVLILLLYLVIRQQPKVIPAKEQDVVNNTQINISAMQLSSSVFSNNQTIPKKYTCDGENINPPLNISDVPNNTQSLALVMEDPDAPGGTFTHWLLWNIDPKITEIKEGEAPGGVLEGVNSSSGSGYIGPCPPSGVHHYIFKLYALDNQINLPSSSKKEELEKIIDGHILDQTKLIGLYSKAN